MSHSTPNPTSAPSGAAVLQAPASGSLYRVPFDGSAQHWPAWCMRMKIYLNGQGLLDVLETPAPSVAAALAAAGKAEPATDAAASSSVAATRGRRTRRSPPPRCWMQRRTARVPRARTPSSR